MFVPTRTGTTAGSSPLRPPVWIVAVSAKTAVCQALRFSYGVQPILMEESRKVAQHCRVGCASSGVGRIA